MIEYYISLVNQIWRFIQVKFSLSDLVLEILSIYGLLIWPKDVGFADFQLN